MMKCKSVATLFPFLRFVTPLTPPFPARNVASSAANINDDIAASEAEHATTRLRVMTYNIQAWRDVEHRCNFDRIVETVRAVNPHILCLNEVLHPFANPEASYRLRDGTAAPNSSNDSTKATGNEIQEYYDRVQRREGRDWPIPASFFPDHEAQTFLHQLAIQTGLNRTVQFCSTVENSNFGDGSHFGNAVLSHLEMDSVEHRLLTIEDGDIDLGNQPRDFVDPRAFSACAIKVPPSSTDATGNGKNDVSDCVCIGVGFVHLDHKSEELRDKQIRRGISETESLLNTVPHLICGDMNTLQRSDCDDDTWHAILDLYRTRGWVPPTERSLVLDSLHELGYEDTFYARECPSQALEFPEPTAWTDASLMRIDHIFKKEADGCGHGIRILDHFRDESTASDHFAVAVDIEIYHRRKE